jgi:hypothetical protein
MASNAMPQPCKNCAVSPHHTPDNDYLELRVELLDFFNIDNHCAGRR